MKDLFVTSRPVSWVNTAYPFAAAYFLVTGRIDWVFVVGTIFFLIPYNLLMYGINDVFDYESDLLNARKGGVEGAVLDRRHHRFVLWAAVIATAPFVLVLATQGGVGANIVLTVSLFAVVAYSAPVLRFKERPFLDSITSSTHFVSPAVYGLALVNAEFSPAVWAVLLAFFLWGMASHAFGAVQDVVPDREANIASIGTVLGARFTAWFSFIAYAMAGVLMLWTPAPFAAVLAVPYLINVGPYLRVTDATSASANVAWKRFLWLNYLTGFLVTLTLIWLILRGS
ncbi:prenyltransferase [Arthrobacter antibioticus]|uniref:prenyltransferase n=1 Tax=Arthrobacter sp. H35-MC1 TaxID=3046203 RepID=UPI0024BAB791|nr:prenyltransferase [Arthrobacter sp. H35-MC1]MDJ0316274.1 prenyltransferase [Arthrobacter sp. H35-MC1]